MEDSREGNRGMAGLETSLPCALHLPTYTSSSMVGGRHLVMGEKREIKGEESP